jgi:hypothetical protein
LSLAVRAGNLGRGCAETEEPMRDLHARIQAVGRDEASLKAALLDLFAANLATQAVIAAAAGEHRLHEDNVGKWINRVAGYPGVLMDKIKDTGDLTVLDRASEIALHLYKVSCDGPPR